MQKCIKSPLPKANLFLREMLMELHGLRLLVPRLQVIYLQGLTQLDKRFELVDSLLPLLALQFQKVEQVFKIKMT